MERWQDPQDLPPEDERVWTSSQGKWDAIWGLIQVNSRDQICLLVEIKEKTKAREFGLHPEESGTPSRG